MIIFIYGPDNFRSRQKLRELKAKFKKDVGGDADSIALIDGEKADLMTINNATSASSLFVRRRLVIIENILANKSKAFLDEVAKLFSKKKEGNSAEDNIIIFWDQCDGEKIKSNPLFKFLAKQKFIYFFKELSNSEVSEWIRSRTEELGLKIEPRAAMALGGIFATDLWSIESEIKKIAHYKQAKQGELFKDGGGELTIVLADVEKLVRGKTDANIFALTDAISQRRKPLALDLLEKEMAAGTNEQQLLFMIQRQFRILLQVRQALDSGYSQRKIITDLKLPPFVVQKALAQVRNFSLEFLKKIFSHLVKIDQKIKTGKTNLLTAIDLLIAKI